MINIFIVDDHGLVRDGIRKILDDATGISVIGDAGSGEEAIDLIRTLKIKPDVVLMDVKMPGIGGTEATRKLIRLFPEIKILALSTMEDDPFPSLLLQAGALGYLTKGAKVDEMVLAIKSVHGNKQYISPEIAQKLALRLITDGQQSPFDLLSERELQVGMMIVDGQKVQNISEALHLSSKTINSYRYRIFDKLRIATDVDLTHLALRYGLVDKDKVE